MYSQAETHKLELLTANFSLKIIPFYSYERTSFLSLIVEARPGIIPLKDFRTAVVTA
jgi:hypothetical protein